MRQNTMYWKRLRRLRDAKFLIEDTEKYIASEIKKGEKDITDEISHAREGHYKAIEREASDIIEEAEFAASNIRNTSKGKIKIAVDSLLSYILPGITPQKGVMILKMSKVS